ncbi:VWA domain-containing protein [Halopseudomonas oceani]|uniref:VWA domain-containing protein n=1 Tax=Halopseudomonas oceani TaxID=1708783 RepID=UPI002AA75540|nr:VWA domain-containing protein [Halopseudomonas oceani]
MLADHALPLTFLRPLWLLGVLPALALCGYLYRHRRQRSGWDGLLPSTLRKALVEGQPGRLYAGRYMLLAAIWTLSLITLAGPAWESTDTVQREDSASLILVLQVSRSMLSNDLQPTRLERAKRKIRDILQRYPDRRVALIAYAGSAHLVAPLTRDHTTLINLLDALHPDIMPARGQQADQALLLAANLRAEHGDSATQVLLLSSGIDDIDPERLELAADRLGQSLQVIGIGTADGAPVPLAEGGFMRDDQGRILLPRLNEPELIEFARSEGGSYARMSLDDSDIGQLLESDFAAQQANAEQRQRSDQGHWLLLVLLPLVALGARRGWLLVAVCALWLPQPASAMSWSDLWQRPDQQAAALLANGKPAAAAALFDDPQWRAQALLDSGDYAAAAAVWGALAEQQPDNAELHFNHGTALALAGDYQQALAAFEQTLTRAPDHTAARHNRQQVEAYLAEQQAQQNEAEDQASEPQPQSGDTSGGTGSETEDNAGAVADTTTETNQGSDSSSSASATGNRTDGDEIGTETRNDGTAGGELTDSPELEGSSSAAVGGGAGSRRQIEQRQAVQQWLRDIPDNPAELLRRKFLYQHLQQNDGRPR